MAKKKVKKVSRKKVSKKAISSSPKKNTAKTLKFKTDHEIATDFAVKAYEKFQKIIKSVVLFGSVEEEKTTLGSDIDIIVIVDDVSLKWDQELIAWYREELDKILQINPYNAKLHINTIRLSTWWDDLMRGDPVVLNIIRSGFPVLDHAGFIEPLKYLMLRGKIKGTPEAIYQCIQRAPSHLARSKAAELTAIDGVYWSMVDAAHGALIAAGYFPPSPEHVMVDLKEAFVDRGFLKMK
ncbi:MAG: nucleotidyltransferase domain-containing protein, partial [Nanoarchaeota archaeon]|nr:nucleotidyltransferase domain-containing protein [Nanoarchaeota archaeon]